jgi:hypothetical protein
MSLEWPTAWDQSTWGVVLSGLALVAAVVAAALAGGARRAAREQRTGFKRARLLRALARCRALADDALRAARHDDIGSAALARSLSDWSAVAGEVVGLLYDGCGLDQHAQEQLVHALDAVGRERSLLLVWADVGATADHGSVRAALQEGRRQLDDARMEIDRRSDR